MKQLIITISLLLFGLISTHANDFVFTKVDVSQGLSDNQVRYITQLSDGRMVFTTSGNVNLYNGKNFSYIHRNNRHIYSLNNYKGHYRVYQSSDSILWIKDKHKLSCLNLYKEEYITNVAGLFKKQGITNQVNDLFVDNHKRVWLLVNGRLILYNTSESIDTSNNHGSLQDVTSDKEYIYLFYNTGEIVCYNIKTKIELYKYSAYPVNKQELYKNTSQVVKGKHGFYQLRNGSKGACFFFDLGSKTWKKILETDYTLNTIMFTTEGTVYISCSHGFWIINTKNNKKQYLPILKTVEGNIINTEISTLFYDKQGALWLGTLNRGLLYYHPSRYAFNYVGRSYFTNEPAKDITVEAFAENTKGELYIRSKSGIYQYNPAEDNKNTLTPLSLDSLPNKVKKLLFSNSNKTSLIDSRGWEWTGTSDGLKLFQPETKKEKILYTEDGLCNNFIHGLLEDHNHNIWLTTSYGISQIQVDSTNKTINFLNYNTFDGTLHGEYTDGAIFEAKNGTLYFGGVNGFNTLKTTNKTPTQLPFKPVSTNLFIRGEIVQIGKSYDERIILTKAIPYTKLIELSHTQNFLTFEFSAINYLNPHQTIYRYMLEGFDNNWQEVSTSEQNKHQGKSGILQVAYTNLPTGKYTFKVKATNTKNYWDEAVSELNIIINTPWWKTPIAYVLYILFLIITLLTGIIVYNRISKERLENKHKEEILFLRIKSLIKQVNQLEFEKESFLSKPHPNNNLLEEIDDFATADSLFISKAIELVEKNLDAPNYSVEQLSRDLCMERTGLYRKLITLLEKSPTLFIRHIRMKKASQLIIEGQYNITEISEKVGFSSSSYFSKCFQETYGCRPSEYANKIIKST